MSETEKANEIVSSIPMNFVFCITRSDTLGGAHIHVADLAEWLIARGHEVVVAVGGTGPFCELLKDKGVPFQSSRHLCRAIDPFSDLKAVLELRKMFRRLNPDLIALHSAKAGLLGRLAAACLGVPVVFTVHGWSFTEGVSPRRAFLYRLLERACASLADRLITVSDYDRQLGLRNRIAPPDRIVTVHNGIPDAIAEGESVQLLPEELQLLMVARFDVQKDHLMLLEALSKLTHLNWRLDLVGDGPLEDVARNRAKTLGLADRIRFHGLRRDVPEFLARADIFLLMSRWEGLPLTILEAMRAGLPVIASAVGGVPEAVLDGETGYLIPRQDVETLRVRLERLMCSPADRLRLGRNGRRLFEQEFSFERMAKRTFAVYEGALVSSR